MFRTLRAGFAKIRLVFNALRSGLYGFVLVCAGWLFLAPPSVTEIERLALSSDATAQHEAVRTHRMAKIVAAVATERIYQLVADRAAAPRTADEIRQGVLRAAEGTSLRGQDSDLGIDAIQKSLSKAPGAKFVPARTTP